jgi:ELWxxDGT repeat protein
MKKNSLFFLIALSFFYELHAQSNLCQPTIFKNIETSYIGNINGVLLFTQPVSTGGLWKSDGTAAGTSKITNAPAYCIFPENPCVLNGFLYFTTAYPTDQLWRTDGTDAGTQLVKDLPNINDIRHLVATNSLVFFLVEGTNYVNKLWKSDGTDGGTALVADLDPTNSLSWDPFHLFATSDFVFFKVGNAFTGVELWKSDGSVAGTAIIKDINPGSLDGTYHIINSGMAELNNKVYFYGGVGLTGMEGLWETDGTEAGTNFVKAIRNISKPYHIGNFLYFLAYDVGAINGGSLYGQELWVTDGTASGTNMVKDIRPGNSGSSTANFSIKGLGSKIVFYANDGISGYEPWISDGSTAGTSLLKDIYPGQTSSSNNFSASDVVGGYIYFSADNGVNGRELWATDGTPSGTVLAADILPGSEGSAPFYFNVFNGNLFFSAQPPGSFDNSIWSCGNFIGINDVLKQTIEIYPNPSSSILNISNVPQGSRIKLINTLGQVLVNKESADAQTTLDVSRFSNGLYTIILEADGGIVTRKVLIEN